MAEVHMLQIEYQYGTMLGQVRSVSAFINADSLASWLFKTMELYGKITIVKVDYID
jgi:hypothetical protein